MSTDVMDDIKAAMAHERRIDRDLAGRLTTALFGALNKSEQAFIIMNTDYEDLRPELREVVILEAMVRNPHDLAWLSVRRGEALDDARDRAVQAELEGGGDE